MIQYYRPQAYVAAKERLAIPRVADATRRQASRGVEKGLRTALYCGVKLLVVVIGDDA